ncbi:MAG: prolipoprotein diacylglyceryl transferase [Chloroflexi bacterium]|nr:prolipoprotein diacylglyceryl transferase [Chloroflexota bacterium]
MNGIVINIDPVALHLGGFAVRWYSLAVGAAILSAILVAAREARLRGIPGDEIYSLALWAVPAGFVGARLFHVIDRWDFYGANPWSILAIQNGGLAIWGGVALGVLAGVLYGRARGLSLGVLADAIAPGLLVGQIVGRLGCIVNGDAFGAPTNLPWGFIYTNPGAMLPPSLAGIPTHPYPVYEMLWNLALLALLWRLRGRLPRPGMLTFVYLGGYSLGRLLLTSVRLEEIVFFGLQQAQALGLAGMVVAAVALGVLARRPVPMVKARPSPR